MDNTKRLHRILLQEKITTLQQEIKSTFDLLNEYEFDSINDLFPEEWKDKKQFIDVITYYVSLSN